MGCEADLPYLDFLAPGFSTRSRSVIQAREEGWCARTPFGLAILRHREVGLLLRDKRLRQGSYAWPDRHGLEGSFAQFWKRSIISTEGEAHRKLRNLAVPALSPNYVACLKQGFSDVANKLLDTLREKRKCEFMEEFSIPFAGQAICLLLGKDPEDWLQISHDASDLGLAMGIDCKSHEETVNAACDRLMRLSHDLIDNARSGGDTTSYVARLVHQFNELGDISEQALLDMVVISIFGGVDTTRSQLGFGMSLFIQNPDQWQKLRSDPDLVPQAIEEIIRAWPTTTWATREAEVDFEFQGQAVSRGETLHMLVHASARDPAVSDSSKFDITRQRKIHFGFGGGAHHCLGAMVARTDMACALKGLAQTLVTLEFDGMPEYLPDSGNTSPVRLPIRYSLV